VGTDLHFFNKTTPQYIAYKKHEKPLQLTDDKQCIETSYALILLDVNPRDVSGVNVVPRVITRRAVSSKPISRVEAKMICANWSVNFVLTEW
jgi:hypothetical protein